MTDLEDLTETPLPRLEARRPDSNKGDYGRALLIGGARGMSGAIALAGKAALRSGAGLVTLAVPQSVQDVVASIEPSYMTAGFPDEDGQFQSLASNRITESIGQNATAIGLGPGIGRCNHVIEFVARLYSELSAPAVVDADALFALAQKPEIISRVPGPRVLTPHPGEFERLTGNKPEGKERIEAAASFARNSRVIVVLKGHYTVITDGHRFALNRTGNPGMATGGSGDVLTGVITALLCQHLEPFDAARLGVHVHGLAGDLAAEQLGQVSLIASDLIDYLPKAFQAVVG
jgi:NAD(P)H-hydrate epimerase